VSNNKHPTESFQRKNATSDLWDQRSRELQLQMYTTVRRHGHGVCAPDLTFHDMTFPPHGNGMAHRPLNGRPPRHCSAVRASPLPLVSARRPRLTGKRKDMRPQTEPSGARCSRPPARMHESGRRVGHVAPASLRALDRGVGELIMPALPRRSG
jgi:hypothetical protein